ncbi:hypothetical protein F4678DRAFT_482969 [Xylaria arbuscula]|nr:hypothetical protein F4678DRAFT_482969 [Xylaria arbuscula]
MDLLWKEDQYRRRDDGLARATLFRTYTNKTEINSNSSDISDRSDVETDNPSPKRWLWSDNPSLRGGPNMTTIGFELEFAVAATVASEGEEDPHQEDLRWFSEILIGKNIDYLPFKFTVKNKLIDTLVAASIPIQKDNVAWYAGFRPEERGFEWWDSLEDDNMTLSDWSGSYIWDINLSEDENITLAVETLVTQFWEKHEDYDLERYVARQTTLENIRDGLHKVFIGLVPRIECIERIKQQWFGIVFQEVKDARERRYAPGNMVVEDPDHVAVNTVDRRYRRWSVIEDPSICAEWPTAASYRIRSPTTRQNMLRLGYEAPSNAYNWFGAELVSPVMDYDNPRTLDALRRATGALRNKIRIHKPLSTIHSGVHIHIGQSAGWTLLHLKKFATLWAILEPGLYRIHRREREYSQYCMPMNSECNLANLIYHRNPNFSRYGANTQGGQRETYRRQMKRFVPEFRRRRRLTEFLQHVWQYHTINQLGEAMGSGVFADTCVRWRISGGNLSDRASEDNLQTLEFRSMQGTLDADHIWKWARILERLVVFARDSTDNEFSTAMTDIAANRLSNSLGLDQEDLQWFQDRRTDDDYFEYPDGDRVDWREPFMAPGHGETDI